MGPGSLAVKRFLWVFVIVVAAGAALWAARHRAAAPATATAPAQVHHFEVAVGQDGEAPHAVDYHRLDERLQRLMADPAMVGLAVGIVENGQIRFVKGYGVTFAGGHEPVTPDTVFRWASLSKGVAADMVASLVNDGRLSLSDPIAHWAPSLHLPNGNENVVTVENLLSQTTGLFAHAEEPNLEGGMDPHVLRGMMVTLHNVCAPGTCHTYQNVVYDASSELVERVTGRPYGDVVRDRFFAPLGMATASTSRAGLMGSQSWARPHNGGHPNAPETVADAYYRVPAAGGINGSIKDLSIWMLAQMGLAGDVLPPAVLAMVQTPRIATPGENRRRRKFHERTAATAYGLGWRVIDYAGHHVIGHHGGVRGYRSMIMFDPQLRSGVVVLWNGSSPKPNGIEYEVMDMVYHLPFRDWLELDSKLDGSVPAEAGGENAGG
jgi:beta-lactamase class C